MLYTDLPHVEDVLLLMSSFVRVQYQVTVPTIELSICFGIHLSQLQVLNAPHLI